MFGGGNSGSRPSAGRGRIWPGGSCCAGDVAERAAPATKPRRQTRRSDHAVSFVNRRKTSQQAVSRILSLRSPRAACGGRRARVTTIPLAPPLLAGSSNLPGDSQTGRLLPACAAAPPYLVLLRAGFCLPPVLPRARCALTAPFHPYPSRLGRFDAALAPGRYIFCATVLRVALTGRYPAHCPAEFGLSSRLRAFGACADGRLACCEPTVVWLGCDVALDGSRAATTGSIRRFPARSGTARASCTDCCAACRSLRRSSRCSSRSRAACRPDTRARRCP